MEDVRTGLYIVKRCFALAFQAYPEVAADIVFTFVENPPNKRISQQLLDMVDKLLLEKIPIECGLLSDSSATSATSATSNGFGWNLTAIPERLLGCMLDADAEELWKSLPPVYRQCAVCYADFWSAYE